MTLKRKKQNQSDENHFQNFRGAAHLPVITTREMITTCKMIAIPVLTNLRNVFQC
jgi:hypothetical protein